MFSLVQDITVCLRCRLRYELQGAPRLTSSTAHLRCSRRWQSSAASQTAEEQPHRDDGKPLQSNETPAQPPRPEIERKGSNYRPDYGFGLSPTSWKHLDVHQDSIELGVNALGKPARIRIVRDRPQRRDERQRKKKESHRPQTFNEEDYAAVLADVTADASQETINKNIEQLRSMFMAQDHKEGFEQLQCAKVADQLLNGVSSEQLAAYAKAKFVPAQTDRVDDLERWHNGRLVIRSRWFSGVTKFKLIAPKRVKSQSWGLLKEAGSPVASEAQANAPKTSRKNLYKKRVVERILREIWGIRERKELANGELDFQLREPLHMELLMQHYDQIFKARAAKFNVRIELDQPRRLVRLSGEYGQTLDVFNLIYKDVQQIKTARINIRDTHRDLTGATAAGAQGVLSTKAYREYIEHLTDTRIVAQERTEGEISIVDSLKVVYLGSMQSALDDVQQLVAHALEIPDPNRVQILCDRVQGSATPTESPIEPGGVLPIRARYSNWRRWSFTPQLLEETKAVARASFKPKVLYRPVKSRKLADDSRSYLATAFSGPDSTADVAASASPHWQPFRFNRYSATIGYLVHRADRKIGSRLLDAWQRTYPTSRSQIQVVEKIFSGVINEPRRFVTGVPDLPMRLENLVSNAASAHNKLRVTLRPYRVVSRDIGDLRSLPELQLTFDVNEDERVVQLKSVQLIRDWRECDLMLPVQGTDIRLLSQSLVRSAEGNVEPAVAKFVAGSDLDFWGSGRLRTPARMTLDVPRIACPEWPPPGAAEAAADASAPSLTEGSSAPDHVRVEYLFKSLEHHSHVEATYQGHRVVYGTVEAGKTGGRWDELRFESDRTKSGALDREQTDNAAAAAAKQAYYDWFDSVREFNARLHDDGLAARHR